MTRRVCSAFVLATFVVTLVLPRLVVSHAWFDPDLSGADAGLFAGHPVTQFEGVHAPVAPEHCALCHWLRSLSSSTNVLPAVLPALARLAGPRTAATDAVAGTTSTRRPARAPPTSFTA